MEEILRLKIKRTESATIEVVPVEDGIEILVLRKEAKKPKIEFHDERKSKNNIEILRAFCSKQKEECETKEEKADLKRFWDFYESKCEDWKGEFKVSTLFEKWKKTAK